MAELALRTLPRAMGSMVHNLRDAGWGSPQRMFVLRGLRRSPAGLGELAERHHVSSATMSVVVTGLEREGLVTRSSDPADGRRVLVRVTDAGQELLALGDSAALEVMTARLGTLSEEELTTLEAGLAVLRRVYGPEADPTPGAGKGDI